MQVNCRHFINERHMWVQTSTEKLQQRCLTEQKHSYLTLSGSKILSIAENRSPFCSFWVPLDQWLTNIPPKTNSCYAREYFFKTSVLQGFELTKQKD